MNKKTSLRHPHLLLLLGLLACMLLTATAFHSDAQARGSLPHRQTMNRGKVLRQKTARATILPGDGQVAVDSKVSGSWALPLLIIAAIITIVGGWGYTRERFTGGHGGGGKSDTFPLLKGSGDGLLYPQREEEEGLFAVVTYNAHLFGKSWASYLPNSTKDDNRRSQAIAAALARLGPDFVGLQEVFQPDYAVAMGASKAFQAIYATLERQAISWFAPKLMGDGLVMLGKYPIEHCTTVAYNDSAGAESLVARGVLCSYVPAGVKGDSLPFCLFVTHTHWGGNDVANRAVRMRNIAQLREIIDTYCEERGCASYLVLADLNITHGSEDYHSLKETFSDCGEAYCDGQPTCDPTANALLQRFHPEYTETGQTQIDYILYSEKDWQPVESGVMSGDFKSDKGEDLSDHYAISALLKQKAPE